jgi:hypothetical protein
LSQYPEFSSVQFREFSSVQRVQFSSESSESSVQFRESSEFRARVRRVEELGSCWKIEWNSLRRRIEELMAGDARRML